jgi:hypothetical protein
VEATPGLGTVLTPRLPCQLIQVLTLEGVADVVALLTLSPAIRPTPLYLADELLPSSWPLKKVGWRWFPIYLELTERARLSWLPPTLSRILITSLQLAPPPFKFCDAPDADKIFIFLVPDGSPVKGATSVVPKQ